MMEMGPIVAIATFQVLCSYVFFYKQPNLGFFWTELEDGLELTQLQTGTNLSRGTRSLTKFHPWNLGKSVWLEKNSRFSFGVNYS